MSDLDRKLQTILKGLGKPKKYNKLEAYFKNQDKSYYFLNDVYYGEANIGRVSKCDMTVDHKESQTVKSTGIIFSTCNYLINLF